MARVPYQTKQDLPSAQQGLYDQIAKPRGGRVPRVFQLLLNSPDIAARIAEVGAYAHSTLTVPADARETAILTSMREAGCQYEFTMHVSAAREAGVRELVIEGIKSRTTKGMLPKESVFVDLAKQVVGRRVNDPTFQAVEHLIGRQGAIDLVMIVGYYVMIADVMMALGVELDPGVAPLMPEG